MTPEWHSPFEKAVAECLVICLSELLPESKAEFDLISLFNLLTTPPNFALGQIAFPCFQLAKKLKSSPPKIAAQIVEKLTGKLPGLIESVQVSGGYVNFTAAIKQLSTDFQASVADGTYFREISRKDGEQVNVEYSQPNTHKALHLGHMRNLFYGDAVCNLLDRVGNKTIRTTYPGDLGTHIAKVLWHLKQLPKSDWPSQDRAIWLGKQYAIATERLAKLNEAEKISADKAIQTVLANLQLRAGADFDLYTETREWSLEEMKRVYAWAGSRFDTWYFESECDEPSRKLVSDMEKQGIFQKSEGAIGLQLGDDLGFALLLKGDGNGLYLTKDLELIKRKFSDPLTARAIYIVDSRQKLHFKQLFLVAERMGFPQAKKSQHLSYESVNDAEGNAFSSRDATGLSLEELRTKIESIVTNEYLARHADEWPAAEIKEAAQKITLAALKYGMLRVDPNAPIKFILAQWISLEGETGPYLQYVLTRCQSLLQKAGFTSLGAVNPQTLEEKELMYGLSLYNKIVEESALDYRPNHLANYLFDTAKLFNRFYKECPILSAETTTKNSRLALVTLTQTILTDGLNLLGIPILSRM